AGVGGSFGTAPRPAGMNLHSSSVERGCQSHGVPVTASRFLPVIAFAAPVAGFSNQRSIPSLFVVVNDTHFPSGDHAMFWIRAPAAVFTDFSAPVAASRATSAREPTGRCGPHLP